MSLLAAASGDASLAFIEIGAVALALALLSRVAGRLRITAIPFYLVAGSGRREGRHCPPRHQRRLHLPCG